MFRRPTLVLLTLLAAVTSHAIVVACPFCFTSSRFPSIQGLLSEHREVLLVEATSARELRIERVLKSAIGASVGDRVSTSRDLRPGSIWILVAENDIDAHRLVALTPRATPFIEGFAALPPAVEDDAKAQAERLAFFLGELGNRDRTVMASVGHAFGKAPYSAVQALKPHLDAERLSTWIETGAPEHRGILALLLAIEGSARARALIEDRLQSRDWQSRTGYDGLLAAYLLVEGESGLVELLAQRPATTARNAVRIWHGKCILRAMDFHLQYETALSRASVMGAAHALFDDPFTSSLAIGFLIRTENWDSLDRVLEVRQKWARERPSIERATRAFLEACPRERARSALSKIRAAEDAPASGG